MSNINSDNYSFYPSKKDRGTIFYYHGGGLIFGNRDDLSEEYISLFTEQGFNLLTISYPLAPENKFDSILEVLINKTNFFIDNLSKFSTSNKFYFWGRSAGAFLALSILFSNKLIRSPEKILSFYGYGVFNKGWMEEKSAYYNQFPKIKKESLVYNNFQDLNTRFPIYMYSRQTGNWIKEISSMNIDEFQKKYSLISRSKELKNNFKYPDIFITHSRKDTDVPFSESEELHRFFKDNKKSNSLFLPTNIEGHDFDRSLESIEVKFIVKKAIDFLKDE